MLTALVVLLTLALAPLAQAKDQTLTVSWDHPVVSKNGLVRAIGDGEAWDFHLRLDGVEMVGPPVWSYPTKDEGADPDWGDWTEGTRTLSWSGSDDAKPFTVSVAGTIRKIGGGSGGGNGPDQTEPFSATWSGDIDSVKLWDPDTGIQGGDKVGGGDGIFVYTGGIVNLAVTDASDSDRWTQGADSDTADDKVTYNWTATPPYGGLGLPIGASSSAVFVAPLIAGEYQIECLIDDKAPKPVSPDQGNRDDGPKSQSYIVTVLPWPVCENPAGCGPNNPNDPNNPDDPPPPNNNGDGRTWDTGSAISVVGINGPLSLQVGETANYNVTATDSDGWTLNGSRQTAPDGVTYTWGDDEGIGDTISWTAPDVAGTYTLSCTIDDQAVQPANDAGSRNDDAVVRTISIRVSDDGGGGGGGGGGAKVWQADPALQALDIAGPVKADTGSVVNYSATASDHDTWTLADGSTGSEDDELHYAWSVDGAAAGGDSASFGWTTPATAGQHTIACTVHDEGAAVVAPDTGTRDDAADVSRSVTLTVGGNHAPVAEGGAATTVIDTPLTLAMTATDADGDTLSYTITTAPAHGTYDGITYTPAAGYTGSDAIIFTASDGVATSNPATLTISVEGHKQWTAGTPIGTVVTSVTNPDGTVTETTTHSGRMTAPQDQTVADYSHDPIAVAANTLVSCAVEAAADNDHWQQGDDEADVADTIKDPDDYEWRGGSFVTATVHHDGGADTYTTATTVKGLSATLLTPASGQVTISCTVSNANGIAVADPDQGTRRDSDLGCTVTLNVTGGPDAVETNLAPIAIVDAYGTTQDTTLNGTSLLANDIDDDGDALSATLAAPAAHGQVQVRANGSFVYIPQPGYSGEDSFRYLSNDGRGGTAVATVELTIAPPSGDDDDGGDGTNHAPVAVVDAGFTEVNTVLHGESVLSNDSDPDGDALTASIATQPGHGAVTIDYLGNYVFTPAADYLGEDTFVATAGDGHGGTATATVIISVIRPGGDDSYTTPRDTALTITAPGVLVNDPVATTETLSASGASIPAHGTVALAGDGSFVYTPAAGYEGVDGFDYLSTRNVSGVARTHHVAIRVGRDIGLTFTDGLVAGLVRACAGGIDDHDARNADGALDSQYQAHTRLVKAILREGTTLMPNTTFELRFAGNHSHDYGDGRAALTARLHGPNGTFEAATWTETLTVTSDANGEVQFWVKSGDVICAPKLQAYLTSPAGSDLPLGEVTCDFAAPVGKRRFADLAGYDPGDSGWLFYFPNQGPEASNMSETGDIIPAKVYLKFQKDPTAGDIDGNWQYANGHHLTLRISSLNVANPDGGTGPIVYDQPPPPIINPDAPDFEDPGDIPGAEVPDRDPGIPITDTASIMQCLSMADGTSEFVGFTSMDGAIQCMLEGKEEIGSVKLIVISYDDASAWGYEQ